MLIMLDLSPDLNSPSRTLLRRRRALPMAAAYAESDLRSALGLESYPLHVEAVSGGKKSLVYFLNCGNRKRGVIYLHNDGNKWRDTCSALRLGEREGLPMPRLLHTRRRGFAGWGPSHWMLTTDYAEGTALKEIDWDRPRLRLLADTLARMHSLESRAWGKLRRPRRKSWITSLNRSIQRRILDLRRHPAAPGEAFIAGVGAFFGRELSSLSEPDRFQLCHHHLFGDDLILGSYGEAITVLDCSSLQFSRASRDLASVREGFFPDEEELWDDFLEAYVRNFSSRRASAWSREIPLFRAHYLLIKLHHHLGRKKESVFRRRLEAVCRLAPATSRLNADSADWN